MMFFKLEKLYNNCGKKNKNTREAWLKKTLGEIPKGKKILDAGAGELQYKKYCEHLEYISQDFGQYNGKGDNRGLQKQIWDNTKLDLVSDIINIPVPDGSFDAIMCNEVLEHIPEPVFAIREFSRIIRRGGELILTAPVCCLTHFAPYFFYNGYSRYFYERILSENGFEIVELTYNGNWFEYIVQELHRLPYMLHRYCGFSGSRLVSLLILFLLLPLFILFAKASIKDSGSSELLSFGMHVRAIKL